MKKPWEETWRLAREGSRTLLCGEDSYPAGDFYGPEGDGRIKLAASAPVMARLLRQLHTCQGSWIDIEDRKRIKDVLWMAGWDLESDPADEDD